MVLTVDDQQQQAPAASPPPTTPVPRGAEVDIELTKNNTETSGWKEVGEITLPGTVPESSPATTKSSDQSPRSRSPRHRPSARRVRQRSGIGDEHGASGGVMSSDTSPSPAIAPAGMQRVSQRRSATSAPSTPSDRDEAHDDRELAPVRPSSGDTVDQETNTVVEPADTSAANNDDFSSESAIDDSGASPAYVGEAELVPENARTQSSVGEPESPENGEPEEASPESSPGPTADDSSSQKKNDGGDLQGVEDTFDPYATAEPKNQGGSKAGAAAVVGAVGGAIAGGPAGAAAGAEAGAAVGGEAAAAGAATGAAETSTTVAAGQEAQVARQNRAEMVGLQKGEQQKTEALNLDMKKMGALQKQLNEFADKEAGEVARKAYKQLWQYTQEGVEDWALSLTDFFLFSGPITVVLYVLRWMLGNMMGDLFTKEVSLPGSTMIPGAGSAKVSINIFPPYELADMQDLERHFKVILIGGITLIIYGFIIMLLYYYTHWAEAIIAAVKAGWTAIITSIPAFQP